MYINKTSANNISNIDVKNQSILGKIGNKTVAKAIGILYEYINKYPPVLAKYVQIADITVPRN